VDEFESIDAGCNSERSINIKHLWRDLRMLTRTGVIILHGMQSRSNVPGTHAVDIDPATVLSDGLLHPITITTILKELCSEDALELTNSIAFLGFVQFLELLDCQALGL
jgi:hypothetical protein